MFNNFLLFEKIREHLRISPTYKFQMEETRAWSASFWKCALQISRLPASFWTMLIVVCVCVGLLPCKAAILRCCCCRKFWEQDKNETAHRIENWKHAECFCVCLNQVYFFYLITYTRIHPQACALAFVHTDFQEHCSNQPTTSACICWTEYQTGQFSILVFFKHQKNVRMSMLVLPASFFSSSAVLHAVHLTMFCSFFLVSFFSAFRFIIIFYAVWSVHSRLLSFTIFVQSGFHHRHSNGACVCTLIRNENIYIFRWCVAVLRHSIDHRNIKQLDNEVRLSFRVSACFAHAHHHQITERMSNTEYSAERSTYLTCEFECDFVHFVVFVHNIVIIIFVYNVDMVNSNNTRLWKMKCGSCCCSFVFEWFFRIEESFKAVHANEYDSRLVAYLNWTRINKIKRRRPANLQRTRTQ